MANPHTPEYGFRRNKLSLVLFDRKSGLDLANFKLSAYVNNGARSAELV